MSRARQISIVLAVVSMTGPATAQDATSDAPDVDARSPRPQIRGEPTQSVSVGFTTAGSMAHPLELEDTASLFVKNGSIDTRWGTAELVAMVEDAAVAVAQAHTGSRLTVGDLSRRHGGRAHPHSSHRAGRDVDIGFYLVDAETDEQVVVDRFINMSGSGRGSDRGRPYRFDAARNWALMVSILADERVDVQFVLINPSIRRILLRHANRIGVDSDLMRRFRDVSARRSGSAGHRSHFHVRIYCATDDRPRCVDAPPFHSWVFTTEDEVQKRLTAWREYSPPPRARRRRRARRGARMRGMRRHAMARARMSMQQTAMRRSMNGSMMRQRASLTSRRVAGGTASSGEPP